MGQNKIDKLMPVKHANMIKQANIKVTIQGAILKQTYTMIQCEEI